MVTRSEHIVGAGGGERSKKGEVACRAGSIDFILSPVTVVGAGPVASSANMTWGPIAEGGMLATERLKCTRLINQPVNLSTLTKDLAAGKTSTFFAVGCLRIPSHPLLHHVVYLNNSNHQRNLVASSSHIGQAKCEVDLKRVLCARDHK